MITSLNELLEASRTLRVSHLDCTAVECAFMLYPLSNFLQEVATTPSPYLNGYTVPLNRKDTYRCIAHGAGKTSRSTPQPPTSTSHQHLRGKRGSSCKSTPQPMCVHQHLTGQPVAQTNPVTPIADAERRLP